MTSIETLRKKADNLGGMNLRPSTRFNKRYMIEYDGQIIHFGSKTGQTFIDHRNEDIKSAWYARHSKITNGYGQRVITLKSSPSYWSAVLLWPK